MYYFLYGLFYLLSLLPWRVLHIISDAAYPLVYYIIRYRRDVVASNLRIAFPEKSDLERTKIEKRFYRNFLDSFVEIIKLLFINEKQLRKHFTSNIEVINNLEGKVPNIVIISAHFFNWEIVNLANSLESKFPLLLVYKPVDNLAFNKLMYDMRKRFGAKLIDSTNFRRGFVAHARTNFALGLVADQSPGDMGNCYWLPFFDKLTGFVKGPEKMSKANKSAVVYIHFYPVKRGHYRLEYSLVTTDPTSYKEGQLTKELVRITEDAIRQEPSNYLWSHRRWKWPFIPGVHSGVVE